MRAVLADHLGTPDVLRPVTLPDPEPGTGQVRVVVEVAAITFIDTLIRAGSPAGSPATFPTVLGNGVGGVIDRVGHDVDPAWIGTRVVTSTEGTGGYASLAVAQTTDLHRVPDRLTLPEATARLADGRTAVGLHRVAGIRPDETVVVTAAGGGVGGVTVFPLSAVGAASGDLDLFALTERALELATQGTIRPAVGQSFPLDDAAAAHAAIESRTTIGKTLLLP